MRKDMRGSKYTYYNSCFFDIASNQKQTGDFSTFYNLFTLFLNMKTKDKTIHIQIKDLNLYKIAILIENFY